MVCVCVGGGEMRLIMWRSESLESEAWCPEACSMFWIRLSRCPGGSQCGSGSTQCLTKRVLLKRSQRKPHPVLV